MEVKVLGSGCANCRRLEQLTKEVVAEMGFDATVEKVEDVAQIMAFGVLSTPGLVIDGQVVCTGRIPDKAELTTMLVNAELAGAS